MNSYVLIDTWWNVNLRKRKENGIRIDVLIDTWWNVNNVSRRDISAGRLF